MIRIGPNEEYILREISDEISETVNSVGLFNRVFARVKSNQSFQKKLQEKKESYLGGHKKIQDVFGIRISLYFPDDEELAIKLVKRKFIELPDSHSIDAIDKDRFGPQRCNLIFRVPDSLLNSSPIFDYDFVDNTFEVQFRTIFSEGWHEVEHDLRYKCKDDWREEAQLHRQLNGILATLETCDWAILKIFDELAYKKYKQKEWPSFFRNLLRIKFDDLQFNDSIVAFLNSNPDYAKELLKLDRLILVYSLAKVTTRIPLKMDNVLFVINRAIIKENQLTEKELPVMKAILDNSFAG